MDYIAYFMLGFGFGISFYYMFYYNNSSTKLDRMKHNLAVRKEWIRMLAVQKTKNPKWPASWEEKLGEKNDRRN
jgi:ribosomal protein S6